MYALHAHPAGQETRLVDGRSTGQVFPAGVVTLSDWAIAVESVLHLGLPWRMLRPQLVNSSVDNALEYKSWLDSLAKEQLSREVRGLVVVVESTQRPPNPMKGCLNSETAI